MRSHDVAPTRLQEGLSVTNRLAVAASSAPDVEPQGLETAHGYPGKVWLAAGVHWVAVPPPPELRVMKS